MTIALLDRPSARSHHQPVRRVPGPPADGAAMPFVSVVVPCFDEEDSVAAAHRRLTAVLAALGGDYEILYVDDGSRDRTASLLADIAAGDPRVRVLRLSRNFGHQVAVTAGLDHVAGEVVLIIDADLQDPPELLTAMLEKWRAGYHVVYGHRAHRAGETAFKRATAALFYRLINRLSDTPIPLDAGDFRLLDRRVVEALRAMPERHRMLRAMTSWVGFRQIGIPYDRAPRYAGVSKYPLRRMLALAIDGILSFSVVPIRLVTLAGLFVCVLTALGSIYALGMRLFTDNWVSGWTLQFISTLLLGGVQLLSLGVIGAYVGRIYGEVKNRPSYLLLEAIGFDRRPGAAAGGYGAGCSAVAGAEIRTVD